MNKEYINNNTSIIKLAKLWGLNVSSNNMIRCPFHDDATPSMKLYKESSSFYCFGCQLGGDIFDFVQKVKNCDFRTAKEIVFKIFKLDLKMVNHIPVRYRPINPTCNNGISSDEFDYSRFKDIYTSFLASLELSNLGSEYLSRRGFNDGIVSEYQLKSCEPSSYKLDLLDYSDENLRKSGLIKDDDESIRKLFILDNSIIIPAFDQEDNIIYFTGRSIYGKKHFKLNNRPSELFVKNLLPEKQYIFESVFDAMSFHQLTGNNNVISINGLSGLNKLVGHKFIDKKLILCLDNDKAAKIAQDKFRKKRDFEVFDFQSFLSKMNVKNQVKDFNELLMQLKKD